MEKKEEIVEEKLLEKKGENVEEKLSKLWLESFIEKKERINLMSMSKRLNCNARSVAMPSDMCDLKDDKVTIIKMGNR